MSDCGGSCDGVCYKILGKHGNYSYACIEQSLYDFCKGSTPNFWILFACLAVVNIILFIAAKVHKGYTSSTCTFVISLIQNILISTFIMGVTCIATFGSEEFLYKALIAISVFFTIVINVITFCACKKKLGREGMFPKDDPDDPNCDLETFVAKAHFNPPLIKVKGVATYTVVKRKRTTIEYMKFKDYIPYQTWRAESNPETLPTSGITIVKVENDFAFSEDINTRIRDKKNEIADIIKFRQGDPHGVNVYNKVYNVKKQRVFGTNCMKNFLESCFGKFIFNLSHALGLSAAFENIYGLTTYILKVSTSRTISGGNDLPTPVLCHDAKAPNCDNASKMPESTLPNSGQQQPQMNMYQQGMVPMQPQPGMPMQQGMMQIQPQPGMPYQQEMIPMQPGMPGQTMPMAPAPMAQQDQQDFVIPNNDNVQQ